MTLGYLKFILPMYKFLFNYTLSLLCRKLHASSYSFHSSEKGYRAFCPI